MTIWFLRRCKKSGTSIWLSIGKSEYLFGPSAHRKHHTYLSIKYQFITCENMFLLIEQSAGNIWVWITTVTRIFKDVIVTGHKDRTRDEPADRVQSHQPKIEQPEIPGLKLRTNFSALGWIESINVPRKFVRPIGLTVAIGSEKTLNGMPLCLYITGLWKLNRVVQNWTPFKIVQKIDCYWAGALWPNTEYVAITLFWYQYAALIMKWNEINGSPLTRADQSAAQASVHGHHRTGPSKDGVYWG